MIGRIFVGLICLMAGMGCDQATPQADPDVEPADILAELGVALVSFAGETDGGCSCRDIWDDHNGDGEMDPDELSPGSWEPSAGAYLLLQSQGPLTLRMRVLSATVRRLGTDIEESVPVTPEQGIFAEREMVFREDLRGSRRLSLPTNLGEFQVSLYDPSSEGEWVWRMTFEVTGPNGEVGTSVLETDPFFINSGVQG